MAFPFRPHAAVTLPDKGNLASPATCPMCHAAGTMSQTAVDAGGSWRCGRCGQKWDANRLAAVAEYAAWVVNRRRVEDEATERRPETTTEFTAADQRPEGQP